MACLTCLSVLEFGLSLAQRQEAAALPGAASASAASPAAATTDMRRRVGLTAVNIGLAFIHEGRLPDYFGRCPLRLDPAARESSRRRGVAQPG